MKQPNKTHMIWCYNSITVLWQSQDALTDIVFGSLVTMTVADKHRAENDGYLVAPSHHCECWWRCRRGRLCDASTATNSSLHEQPRPGHITPRAPTDLQQQPRAPTDFQQQQPRAPEATHVMKQCNHHHNRFTALFPGPPGWAGARRDLLDFMMQGKINRGRHTDHLAGHHSTRLTSAHLHHSPHFLTDRMPFLPPNQQRQSTERN